MPFVVLLLGGCPCLRRAGGGSGNTQPVVAWEAGEAIGQARRGKKDAGLTIPLTSTSLPPKNRTPTRPPPARHSHSHKRQGDWVKTSAEKTEGGCLLGSLDTQRLSRDKEEAAQRIILIKHQHHTRAAMNEDTIIPGDLSKYAGKSIKQMDLKYRKWLRDDTEYTLSWGLQQVQDYLNTPAGQHATAVREGRAAVIITEDSKLPSGKHKGICLKDVGAGYRIAICKKPRNTLGKLKSVRDYLNSPAGQLATTALFVCNWPIEKLEAYMVDVGPFKGMTIGELPEDYRRDLMAKENAKGRTKDLRLKVIYLERLKPSPAPSTPAAVAASAYARAAPVTPMREGGAGGYGGGGGGGGMASASLAPVKKEEEGRGGRRKATPRVRPIRVRKRKEEEGGGYVPVRVKRERKGRGGGQEGTSLARGLKKEEEGGGGGGDSSRAPPMKKMRVKNEEEESVVVLPGEPFQVNPSSVL